MSENTEVAVVQGTNQQTNEPPAMEAEVNEVDYKDQAEKLQAEVKKLQTSLTRQGYELGELRQIKPMVDKLLLTQQTKADPIDFFTDPEQAVARGISEHPEILRIKEEAENLRRQRMVLQLKEAHPDYTDVAKDTDFIDWVQASKVRARLFQEGNNGYDFDSANELLELWKERKTIAATSQKEQEQKQKSESDLKSAKVHTGSGVVTRKTWTRLELMKLRTHNPDAYQELDVNRLYAEGRVKR